MKLTIVTVNLNHSQNLKKTLESVQSQRFDDLENLVIDGLSTDESLEILGKWKPKYGSYDFVSESDTGIYNAMNKGISKSKGDYILFLNSGDVFAHENVLSNVFDKNRYEDLLFGNIIVDNNINVNEIKYGKLDLNFIRNGVVCHQSQFWRREILQRLGGFDEQFLITADYDFFVRALVKANVSYFHFDFPIAIFRLDGMSNDPKNLNKIASEREAIFSGINKGYVADTYQLLDQYQKDLDFFKNQTSITITIKRLFYLLSKKLRTSI
ncbi:MAG: glycosyltransferase family 2 protein [Leptospira sp.]|nr:glycosyltransferase family 2 protein [Leptospira sp.]